MKLLDLFCCGGVDIAHQSRYPFQFVQGDALEYLEAHGHEFDAIHASPPCQGYSHLTPEATFSSITES